MSKKIEKYAANDRIVEFEDVLCTAKTTWPDGSTKALLCVIEGDDKWVPFSQVDDDSEVYKVGDEGILTVNRWWAEKAGLI